jgi:hypothetical protein
MIGNMSHDIAIKILIQYGYTLDQSVIPLVDEVTVLSSFGTESFIDSEQTDGQGQAQNIVENNDLIDIDSYDDSFDDALHLHLYDEKDIVKTHEWEGKLIYKSNAIKNMIHMSS